MPRGVLATRNRETRTVNALRGIGHLLRGRTVVVPRPIIRRVRNARRIEDRLVVDQAKIVDESRDANDAVLNRRGLARRLWDFVPRDGRIGDALREIKGVSAHPKFSRPATKRIRDVWVIASDETGSHLLLEVVGRRCSWRGLNRDVRMCRHVLSGQAVEQFLRIGRLARPPRKRDRCVGIHRGLR